ncbi:hypothetical protein CDD82_3331 [Ophiocordyceps australis]|uniref:FAD-binding domain-containing protein n=1 Tax=Ophiocordyceps australis TaxID=1399860 RepID=A0A2C5ZT42_9HYPO|nr:hypothetical protein CDD82_3331 [Ophiocordyceps australis]
MTCHPQSLVEQETGHRQDTKLYDAVIIGAGPAGLMLSTCLARWGYRIKHIDNRPETTRTGRADGIQPRSLDILRGLGLKSEIMAHKPARVYEVAFWSPSNSGISRTSTWATCPSFINARYPFTTMLHQGHIENVFIRDLAKHGVGIQRPWTIHGFTSDPNEDPEYPVRVELKHVDGSKTEIVRTRYLFGGEGSKSFIRQQLGIAVHHLDPIEHVWGVIDGVVDTDFPDIKIKCTIHSTDGSIMVLPREDKMVRIYVQLPSTGAGWSADKTATEIEIKDTAKRIMRPYSVEWRHVEWYSVYPIGQGIAKRYTLDERVFLGGDACHTHSPKAGQGMNTAFQDALNLAWKIHAVEGGFAKRSLLRTYEEERKSQAERLLSFDNKFAKLFSQPETEGENEESAFIRTFKEACELTSGYGVQYGPNVINWSTSHPEQSHLIQSIGTIKLVPGSVFVSADVTRVTDANVVHLEHEKSFDGSFRIFVFAGDLAVTGTAVGHLAEALDGEASFCRAREAARFVTLYTVLAMRRNKVDVVRDVPGILGRDRDLIFADDRWDRRVPEAEAAAHARLGFDKRRGGVVVVRPDGHVGVVIRLAEGRGTFDALQGYFDAFVARQPVQSLAQL